MHNDVKRSFGVFPAASNGEFDLPPNLACVIQRGEGSHVWTTEGRQMLDFSIGWGAVLPGHACPEVVEAVRNQVGLGTQFAYVSEPSLKLAEEVVKASPACESVRFCASGTEATMYCLRLARAFTGKKKILKFEGAYHGSHDVGLSSLFPKNPPEHPQTVPSCAGLEPGISDTVLAAPFNDLETTQRIIAEHKDEIAAVIMEPLQRCLPPIDGFIAGVRKAVDQTQALLIFDEVVTGFRLAYGGAQEYYGVQPDLVAYGKALGGGLPMGAFGGRKDVMDLVCEDRLGEDQYVWMACTTGGNPISTAAGLAALEVYRREDTYERLHSLGAYLRKQMREVTSDLGITAQIVGDGPLAQVVFTEYEVKDYRTTQVGDKSLARDVMLRLFQNGIFLNPMGTKLYLSLAHTRASCDQFCEAFRKSLEACLQQTQVTA